MLALNGEHHGAHLAGLWRSPKSMEARPKNYSAIRHAGELTHPALSSRLVTLNKGFFFAGTKRECYVRPNGADRQWVEVPPR